LRQRSGERGFADVFQTRNEISMGCAPALDSAQQKDHSPIVADDRPG
jgi:hypothetical protein